MKYLEHFLDQGRIAVVLRMEEVTFAIAIDLNSWLVGIDVSREHRMITIHLLCVFFTAMLNPEEDELP